MITTDEREAEARQKAIDAEFRLALRKARNARGWTQKELGKRLGVTQSYICMIEKGHSMNARVKVKIRRLLGLAASKTGTSKVPPTRKAKLPVAATISIESEPTA